MLKSLRRVNLAKAFWQQAQERSVALSKISRAASTASDSKAEHQKSEEKLSEKAKFFVDREDKYGAHNYHPLPVVIDRAEGFFILKYCLSVK